MMQGIKQRLKRIYEDPRDPGSFGGIQRLFKSAKAQGVPVNLEQVKEFAKSERPYQFHKPARKRFSRNPTIVSGIDVQWQADLVDMQSLSRYNKGFKYILTVIDCFSKFAWAVPLKAKTGLIVREAFKQIFETAHRSPRKLQTDKGKEFLNSTFQDYMKQMGILHFTTDNAETKAAIAERFNRTLKTRMWTYFTTQGTNVYIDVLQKLVDSYNESFHRSIGMRPIDVRKVHEQKIFQRLYAKPLASSRDPKSTVGPYVRISKAKQVFDKGYRPNWSSDVFKVQKKHQQPSKTLFELEEIGSKQPIKGRFYPEEVQTIDFDPTAPQPIEKIVKSRIRNGIKEMLVKWLDYPNSQNSWVKESEIEDQ